MPKLDVLAKEFSLSDNTLGKHLRRLVGMGLLAVSNPKYKKWRYARYSLPVEGQEADSITEEEEQQAEGDVNWRFAEEKAEEPEDEQVEEVSEVGLVPYIERHSQLIRTERVMLDVDVGNVYGVSTREINQAKNNNPVKFTDPTTGRQFAFQLNDDETKEFESKSLIQKSVMLGRRGENPWVYTQEGCNMLATILKSDKAVLRSIQIIKVFTDLERMAHGEEPKQPGFVELMQMIVEQNKMVTANIVQLTTGVSSITTELDTRKADKKAVDEVKQTAEEAQRQAEEAKQKAAEVGIKIDDVTAKVDNLVNQDVINNRQMLIDQYRHIVTWLKYWEIVAPARQFKSICAVT